MKRLALAINVQPAYNLFVIEFPVNFGCVLFPVPVVISVIVVVTHQCHYSEKRHLELFGCLTGK